MGESKGPDDSVARGSDSAGAIRGAAWKEYVCQCALGDSMALGKLYDETNSLVYSIALRMLADRLDAEEVTLDVFSQVWRTAGGYDPARGSVMAWLVTLARSRSIDKVRSRGVRSRMEQPFEEGFEIETEDAGPEEWMALSQTRTRVRAALAELSPEQRQALELSFFSGLTHSELAEHLRRPLGTIKTHIRLGMMKMRLFLEDQP